MAETKFGKTKMGIFLLMVVYLVGIVGFLIPDTRNLIIAATPINILFCTFLLLYFHVGWHKKLLFWLAAVGVLGYFLEVAGVQTKVIFGDYWYGPNLGPGMLGVPFMMAINWIMLTYMSAMLVASLSWPVWVKAIVSALVMVGYDVVLEPVAMQFDMWSWKANVVPLQNYIVWLVAGFAFQWVFHEKNDKRKNPLIGYAFVAQLTFFLVALKFH